MKQRANAHLSNSASVATRPVVKKKISKEKFARISGSSQKLQPRHQENSLEEGNVSHESSILTLDIKNLSADKSETNSQKIRIDTS
jgi:lysyl-tRNA synthetase class II